MKNKFLMMMFFFAFMVIGIQDMNAQYVHPGQAMNMLQAELQVIENNPIYTGSQENHPQFMYLISKHDFYTVVFESLVLGDPVADSIQNGLDEIPSVTASVEIAANDTGTLPPIHQEIVDLLEE